MRNVNIMYKSNKNIVRITRLASRVTSIEGVEITTCVIILFSNLSQIRGLKERREIPFGADLRITALRDNSDIQ